MSQRSDALADRLEQGARALATFASALTDTEWNSPVPRDGRKVGVVVHHVASMYPLEIQLAQRLAGGALLRRAKGRVADFFVTFGRVPFLLYVAHLYLVHALAVAAGVAQGFPGSAIRTVYRLLPEGYGFGLPVVYLVWIGVVAVLYPVCRWYAALKTRSRAWWLSYL